MFLKRILFQRVIRMCALRSYCAAHWPTWKRKNNVRQYLKNTVASCNICNELIETANLKSFICCHSCKTQAVELVHSAWILVKEKYFSVLYVELERKFVQQFSNMVYIYIMYVLQSQLLKTNNRSNKVVHRLTQSCRRRKIYRMWNAT